MMDFKDCRFISYNYGILVDNNSSCTFKDCIFVSPFENVKKALYSPLTDAYEIRASDKKLLAQIFLPCKDNEFIKWFDESKKYFRHPELYYMPLIID